MNIDTAKSCFKENIQRFGDPNNQPENFNLYNGLYCLSEAVSELKQQIGALRQEIRSLRSSLLR